MARAWRRPRTCVWGAHEGARGQLASVRVPATGRRGVRMPHLPPRIPCMCAHLVQPLPILHPPLAQVSPKSLHQLAGVTHAAKPPGCSGLCGSRRSPSRHLRRHAQRWLGEPARPWERARPRSTMRMRTTPGRAHFVQPWPILHDPTGQLSALSAHHDVASQQPVGGCTGARSSRGALVKWGKQLHQQRGSGGGQHRVEGAWAAVGKRAVQDSVGTPAKN